MGQAWRAMQPKLGRLQQIRRYYLSCAAEPSVPFHGWKIAPGETPLGRQAKQQDRSWARILADDAFDRHRPEPAKLTNPLREFTDLARAIATRPAAARGRLHARPSAAAPHLTQAQPRLIPLSSVFCLLGSDEGRSACCGPDRCWLNVSLPLPWWPRSRPRRRDHCATTGDANGASGAPSRAPPCGLSGRLSRTAA